jgi:hypothetical protein
MHLDVEDEVFVLKHVHRLKDGVRAQMFGPNSRHGGTHAELSRFIRGSAHYGAIPSPGDHYGLAAQLRIVPLLYGRLECVHIDMNDLATGHLANHLIPESR